MQRFISTLTIYEEGQDVYTVKPTNMTPNTKIFHCSDQKKKNLSLRILVYYNMRFSVSISEEPVDHNIFTLHQ